MSKVQCSKCLKMVGVIRDGDKKILIDLTPQIVYKANTHKEFKEVKGLWYIKHKC